MCILHVQVKCTVHSCSHFIQPIFNLILTSHNGKRNPLRSINNSMSCQCDNISSVYFIWCNENVNESNDRIQSSCFCWQNTIFVPCAAWSLKPIQIEWQRNTIRKTIRSLLLHYVSEHSTNRLEIISKLLSTLIYKNTVYIY